MADLYGVLDVGSIALTAHRMQANVSAENIANANRVNYVPKSVDLERFQDLINEMVGSEVNDKDKSEIERRVSELIIDQTDIRLDDEIYLLNKAKGKYSAISQMMKMRLSLIDIAIGSGK